jgi:hypothetical protein
VIPTDIAGPVVVCLAAALAGGWLFWQVQHSADHVTANDV